jgi:hypothetical protein
VVMPVSWGLRAEHDYRDCLTVCWLQQDRYKQQTVMLHPGVSTFAGSGEEVHAKAGECVHHHLRPPACLCWPAGKCTWPWSVRHAYPSRPQTAQRSSSWPLVETSMCASNGFTPHTARPHPPLKVPFMSWPIASVVCAIDLLIGTLCGTHTPASCLEAELWLPHQPPAQHLPRCRHITAPLSKAPGPGTTFKQAHSNFNS